MPEHYCHQFFKSFIYAICENFCSRVILVMIMSFASVCTLMIQVGAILCFFTFSKEGPFHCQQSGLAINIVTDANFVPTLQKLLTGSCTAGADMRSDVVSLRQML